ncbi:MAG: hypothetical protein EZS26_001360 [Candidatus Ordinivivax streblomastigis]|uniref:DUF3943 domain-containing protein n=1 Tax=Candidatus Ordinivivax streblomastigis TaxID=2540710 RepID=A0A5M8P2C3_9BACT|nr:MAG: hypothetical protein EZS26_001360 [Candidatus Ordinivivax streblomastigis]
MKEIVLKILLTAIGFLYCKTTVLAQWSINEKDTILQKSITIAQSPVKRAGIALTEGVALNLGIHLVDRFVLKEEWAQVTPSSIRYNLTHKSIWDNDMISTNLFAHPYCGGLYFNAARTNGFNFWQSIPFAFVGSSVWECFGENQPASLNDMIATPIGGIAFGEITHQLSHLILDDSQRGWRRFGTELLAGIISPMDLLNRVLSGDAWRFSPRVYNGESPYLHPAFRIDFSVYNRFLTDLNDNKSNENMGIKCRVDYGEAFTSQNHNPYDFFMFDINFTVWGKQPFLSEVNLVGILWGKEWNNAENSWLAGIFQHFDYYDSNPIIEDGRRLYEFAETASFGGGLLYKKQREETQPPRFCGSVYANLVLLGASESDYYHVDKRNYNLGNGYSIKLNGLFHFGKHWDAFLGLNHYHIFTSKGYGSLEAEINGLPSNIDFNYANVQGNKGHARLDRINLNIGFQLSPQIKISAEQRLYSRRTHYNYLEDVETSSTENRLQITYTLSDNNK